MILFYDYKASVGDSLLAFSSSNGT
jgi:hypothetical protein